MFFSIFIFPIQIYSDFSSLNNYWEWQLAWYFQHCGFLQYFYKFINEYKFSFNPVYFVLKDFTIIPKLGSTVISKCFQWHQYVFFSSWLYLSNQGRWKFNFFKDMDPKVFDTDILILSMSVSMLALFFGIYKSSAAVKRLGEYLLFGLTSCLGPKI